MIQNTGTDAAQVTDSVLAQNQAPGLTLHQLSLIPAEPEMAKRLIKEMGRVHISLGEGISGIQGYMVTDDYLAPLPIDSTLDAKKGTFSWIPGPGFLGKYTLVFVDTDTNGQPVKKTVDIEIVPKNE